MHWGGDGACGIHDEMYHLDVLATSDCLYVLRFFSIQYKAVQARRLLGGKDDHRVYICYRFCFIFSYGVNLLRFYIEWQWCEHHVQKLMPDGAR